MEEQRDVPIRTKSGSRQISNDERKRFALPRRSTKGPLDQANDLLSPPPSALVDQSEHSETATTELPRSSNLPTQSTLLSPTSVTTTPATPARRMPSPGRPPMDLSFLLLPTLYNPMPPRDVAAPFINSKHQPAPDTPLEDLLARGFFRHAADRAADDLTSGAISGFDHETILQLYQIRLSCLMLVSRSDFATQEARPMIDWTVRNSGPARAQQERQGDIRLIPWDLRILLHRLHTLSSSDYRRGVMGLYNLGSECRAAIAAARRASDTTAAQTWSTRLTDLGIRVAGELVEMGEHDAAIRHLSTLSTAPEHASNPSLAIQKALIYLRIGNIDAAARTITALGPSEASDSITPSLVTALIHLAKGNPQTATSLLSTLHASHPGNELVTTNLAVAALYAGNLDRAYDLLSSLVENKESLFPGLLFNMATLYELRTVRAGERKLALADRVADLGPGERGWERVGAEFKL